MTISIGANIASARAASALTRNSATLSRSFERLSSGMRINRAADDAAGLSVSSALGAKASVLGRAALNLSDGISTLSIADGTLSNVSSVLQRMAELAEQTANGTFSLTQRRALNTEYQQLALEINRIAESTTFNGLQLLTGTKGTSTRRLLYTPSSGTVGSPSSITRDGNYIAYVENGAINVRDTRTGEVHQVTLDPSLTPVSGAANIQVLANGDVFFHADDSGSTFRNIYRYTWDGGQLTQLTNNTQATQNYNTFAVSADGTTLGFMSLTRYQNGGTTSQSATSDNSWRYYAMNIATGILKEDSYSVVNAAAAGGLGTTLSISANGEYASWISSTGRLSVINNTAASIASTRTDFAVTTLAPAMIGISNSGKAFFTSDSSPTGQNSSHYRQVFSFDSASSTSTQLTSFNATYTLSGAFLSADEQSVFFHATSDLTGENSAGIRQIFKIDVNSRTLTQKTNFSAAALSGVSFFAGITGDGGRVFGILSGGTSIYDLDATNDSTSFDFEVGNASSGGILAAVSSIQRAVRGLSVYALTNQFLGRAALNTVTDSISNISAARGVLGASLSRLLTAQNVVLSQRDEVLSAQSRIRDVDVAEESAKVVRGQILQQVGSSVLARANIQPELALRLLGNR